MKNLALGLMSGTSADGVSLTLASFDSSYQYHLIDTKTYPYPRAISQQILNAGRASVPNISRLNFNLGEIFSDFVLRFLKKNKVRASEVRVLGSHGQTVYHEPRGVMPNTFQIGESSILAERTGISVVSDFRPRDIARGGEGAPLLPFFDQTFFGGKDLKALQNIGGIANVTVAGKKLKEPFAFDTGPGNCLIDWAVQKITQGKRRFDFHGKLASKGKVSMDFVRDLFRHPYFKDAPPKSTGRELFNENFIPSCYKKWMEEKPRDFVATLTYFTAFTVAESYQRFIFSKYKISEVILSGGGVLNHTLVSFLTELLSPIPVHSIEKYGIPALAKESLAFAFFALRAVDGRFNSQNRILGKITPGKNFKGIK